ncbi:MAG: hypothetical protein ACREHD_27715, partial [Pirellulales bacterium]
QLAGRTQMDGGTMTSIAAESLASLGRLEKLKHLNLERASALVHEMHRGPRLIRDLPRLAQLQTLNLDYAEVGDDDLRRLSAFPRLRSLSLAATDVTRTGLARLAPLEALEELAIDGEMVSAAGLKSLLPLAHLKKLHIVQRFRSFRFDLPFATLPREAFRPDVAISVKTGPVTALVGSASVAAEVTAPKEIATVGTGEIEIVFASSIRVTEGHFDFQAAARPLSGHEKRPHARDTVARAAVAGDAHSALPTVWVFAYPGFRCASPWAVE